MSSERLVCTICHKPSAFKCGACRQIAYCSKEHQKIDWKTHKKNCILPTGDKFKIAENGTLGRYLVSTKFISEGEVILEEAPLVSGPLQLTPPVCLGCYTVLNEFNRRDCTKCGWPLCSERCEKSETHRPECEITVKFRKDKVVIKNLGNGLNHPSYESITVLRCLDLKDSNKAAWDRLSMMESHTEQRKNTEKYKSDVTMIAEFIRRFYKYDEFTEDEILKIAGIVQVNGHHVPLKDPGFVSIYDKASILEHNCHANCSKSFTNNSKIRIIAARPIQEGEHLSISYTEPLWGLMARRDYLKRTKFFICQCVRCTDPTELGTNFNSFKCLSTNCHGYMSPLIMSVIQLGSMWRCSNCERTANSEDLSDLFNKVATGVSNLDKTDPESCRRFLDDYKRHLHPNNYFMVNVKLSFVQCFDGERLMTVAADELQFLIQVCQDLIDLTARLVPAENRLRGILHFHLHAALAEFDRRRAMSGEVDGPSMQQNLLACRDILKKAYTFLKSEPESLPEGKMAAEAASYIQDINKILEQNQLF